MLKKKIALVLTPVLVLTALLLVACGQSTPTPTAPAAPLAIITTSLADGKVGIDYSQTLKASGGSGTYTWSIANGTLPSGLDLVGNTGGIKGMPQTAGTANFTTQVSDGTSSANQSLSITIRPSLPQIDTVSLAVGEVSIAYLQTLHASGGSGTYTWSISKGTLPGGLVLNADTRVISGTPQIAGIFPLAIQITDSLGNTASQSLSLTINAAVSIATASLPDGTVGKFYDQNLAAAGGIPKCTWSISNGSLPQGLAVSAANGEIYGTPKVAGTANFTLQAIDSLGKIATRPLSITINAT